MKPGALDRSDREATIRRLRDALGGHLPGETAHRGILPAGTQARRVPEGIPVANAAVLLVLHPDPTGAGFRFPLIVRADSMAHHAGQIGLPGGAVDKGEQIEQAALREAWEEIALEPGAVELLGELTPIVIPISRFQVRVVVGWTRSLPAYRPQDCEVLRVLLADPDRLAREGPSSGVEQERGGQTVRFPAYSVEGEAVWGATALILAEFLWIWTEIRDRRSSHGVRPGETGDGHGTDRLQRG